MNTIQLLNITGLSLDIVGVILLFFFAIPNLKAANVIEFAGTKKENRVKKLFNVFSYLALAFLIVGFILQIIANTNCFK